VDDLPSNTYVRYEIGDIVCESLTIIPPERKQWIGIVVYVERNYFDGLGMDYRHRTDDGVGIHWFKPNYVEHLPSSVIELIQRCAIKPSEKT